MLICLIASASYAQPVSAPAGTALHAYNSTFTVKTTPDTTVNADTTYLANISSLTTDYNVTYRGALQNVTGTTGGYIYAQGSDDYLTWYNVHRSGIESTVSTDSITVSLTSGAVQTFNYKWPSHQYYFYRIVFRATGTQTSVMTGTADLRKKVVIVSQ